MIDSKEFKTPPSEYGVIPFWFLNHQLNPDEAKRQIREMKEKGISGFFLHSRAGLLTPYISEDWFEIIGVMIEEAKRNGMKAWLYDEDPYPSGVTGGKVVFERPEFRARGLKLIEKNVNGNEEIEILIGRGRPVSAFAVPVIDGRKEFSTVVDVTKHIGILRKVWGYRYWDSRYYYPAEKYHEHWRSETHCPDYYLKCVLPEGKWLVCIFSDEEFKGTLWDSYVDLLNPNAIDYFIETTHAEYYKRFGKYFGNTIPGIFTDEPKVVVPLPWTRGFDETFKKLNGYDIKEKLLSLRYDTGKTTPKVRADYRKTILKLMKESFFDNIYKWCDSRKIKFTGHVSPEEEPYQQAIYLSNLIPILKSFHIPGTDIIVPTAGCKGNECINLGPKLVSSASYQDGKKRIMCESFACSDWKLTPEDMKWISDWLFVLGVNMIVPHGFFYSIDGYRKMDAGPSQFYQYPHWDNYARFNEYIARISYVMSESREVAEIGLMYPMKSIWSEMAYKKQDEVDWTIWSDRMDPAGRIKEDFLDIVNFLLKKHFCFHIVDEDKIKESRVASNKIVIGKCSYKTLIIPPVTMMSRRAFKRIEEFCERGGKVISLSELPEKSEENGIDEEFTRQCGKFFEREHSKGKALFIKGRDYLSRLERTLLVFNGNKITIRGKGSEDIFVTMRENGADRIIFLLNLSRDTREFEVIAPVRGNLYLFDCNDGNIYSEDSKKSETGMQFSVKLDGRESKLYVVSPRRHDCGKKAEPYELSSENTVAGTWDFSITKENVLLLNKFRTSIDGKTMEGEKEPLPLYMIKKECVKGECAYSFTGDIPINNLAKPVKARYSTHFFTRLKKGKFRLVFEEAGIEGKFTIRINGKKVSGYKPSRDYDCKNVSADITKLIKCGSLKGIKNMVEVSVEISNPRGGLLQPLRIYGDFSVMKDRNNKREYITGPAQKIELKSWAGQGYPYYCGQGVYEKEIDIEETGFRTFVELEKIYDTAEVWVNGKKAGLIMWKPYCLDITELIKQGRNRIKLIATNSAENLFYGSMWESGVIGKISIIQTKERVK